ncbi:MAG: type VI secretion system tip protein VgrG [Proteobacteria bacterium]|nr:type VI secretion system tip protein VgrG [Pseudomonadota bacterium]
MAMRPNDMEIDTPLGPGQLLFRGLVGREELGRPFEYQLDLLSRNPGINFADILGKSVTVKLALPSGDWRYFNGYVTRFAQVGMLGRYSRYTATLRPWLWLLTRTANCRIFQDLSVPKIVDQVMHAHPPALVDSKCNGDYRTWDYCSQYRETDFNFVSRLLEQEGIYYYFRHDAGQHTLVLADAPTAHDAFPGYAELPFAGHDALNPDRDGITNWELMRTIQPGIYTHDDYDFERPGVELQTTKTRQQGHDFDHYEVYDFPGEYLKAQPDGEQYATVRIEELAAQYEIAQAVTNARGLSVGSTFKLTDHPRDDQNQEYLVVAANYALEYNEYESLEDTAGSGYRCSFTCMPSSRQFRPQRTTPKPSVQGPQTAVVVGPSGEEIHTDKYGRVKVQFHWDRDGKKNENSSCWMRVSQPWAGKGYGMIALPRIGQEVIVDFLEGDPDEPIVTGRVYNAEQMPPWALPDNKTQSGVLSRSTKQGAASNANAIRFEDKKGAEQLWIHAERNQDIEVEADETHWVGHDRSKKVDHDETVNIGHDRTETVGNNETITIGNDRTESVGGNETVSVAGQRSVTISGADSLTVGGSQTITVGGSSTETIAVNVAQTVGGTLTQTVTGAISITTPQAMSITATAGLNITAPAGVNLLGGTTINGLTSDSSWLSAIEYSVTGLALGATGVNIEMKGVDISVVTMKGESAAISQAEHALNSVASGLQMLNPLTHISNGAIALYRRAMTIVS